MEGGTTFHFVTGGIHEALSRAKEAANGNHFLVLTEGKRDEKTNEVRKSRLFIYSEDFVSFFQLMKDSAVFIKGNPVPEKVKAKQAKVQAAQDALNAPRAGNSPPTTAAS